MKNFKQKAIKIGLVGAMAIGGLAGAALMDSPNNPLSATKASAASNVYASANVWGEGTTQVKGRYDFQLTNPTASHQGKTGTWTIKSGSTTKASGSFTLSEDHVDGTLGIYYYESNDLYVTVSGYANGTYTFNFSYTAGGVTYSKSKTFTVSGGKVTSVY